MSSTLPDTEQKFGEFPSSSTSRVFRFWRDMLVATRRRKRRRSNGKPESLASTDLSDSSEVLCEAKTQISPSKSSFTSNCEEVEKNALEEIDTIAESPPGVCIEEEEDVKTCKTSPSEEVLLHNDVDLVGENMDELMQGLCPEDVVGEFSLSAYNSGLCASFLGECNADLSPTLPPSLCSTPLHRSGGTKASLLMTGQQNIPLSHPPCSPLPGFLCASSLYSQQPSRPKEAPLPPFPEQDLSHHLPTSGIGSSEVHGVDTFYGLPLKVKELLKELRGIQNLYGKGEGEA